VLLLVLVLLQAKFLSWHHLTKEQLSELRAASCRQSSPLAREVLQEILSAKDPLFAEHQQTADGDAAAQAQHSLLEHQRQEVVLDLFSYTLKQGQVRMLVHARVAKAITELNLAPQPRYSLLPVRWSHAHD
jgi:hypothetical protein